MIKTWQYLSNQFENVTQKNYKKSVKISNYHDAALKLNAEAEPLLIPIYEGYHPLHQALVSEYNKWKSAGGRQEGQTLNLEQRLDLAYSKMQFWDISIQGNGAAFIKGSPNYLTIFMNGRKPFTQGSLEDRINAYDTLAKNMEPFAPLASIMAEVAATYIMLDNARDAQLGAKGILKTGSGKVEAARKEAMTMQWRNLGFAMYTFWDKPKYIESMFDVQTLRESRQRIFTGTLDPAENEAVLIHTFLNDDELRLKNNGNATINFYLATTANGMDSTAIAIVAHTEVVVEVSRFGAINFATHRFLTAVNQSPTVATHYEVEVL